MFKFEALVFKGDSSSDDVVMFITEIIFIKALTILEIVMINDFDKKNISVWIV